MVELQVWHLGLDPKPETQGFPLRFEGAGFRLERLRSA